mgnify:CR=1 FL=1
MSTSAAIAFCAAIATSWKKVTSPLVSSSFAAVVPAYHMNKLHWVSIILDGSMSDEEIRRLVHDSYRLTAPKKAAKKGRT